MFKEAKEMDRAKKIKAAIAYAGLSQTELAARMGISKAGLSNRISADTFREKDMEKVARAAGCEYVSYFQFPDGAKI